MTTESAAAATASSPASGEDFLPINGTDYVEFYVGNAKQAAYFYMAAFGFEALAYAGLETGLRDRTSFVVQQGKIRFVLTSALHPDSVVSDHVKLHGDGVRDIAMWVDDARLSFRETVARGATPVLEPTETEDKHGRVVRASIRTYGDTIHTFVERKDYAGTFMPGFLDWNNPYFQPASVGLKYVDHCVGNVHLGDMNKYVDFYADVLGFRNLLSFDDKDISTEYGPYVQGDGKRE